MMAPTRRGTNGAPISRTAAELASTARRVLRSSRRPIVRRPSDSVHLELVGVVEGEHASSRGRRGVGCRLAERFGSAAAGSGATSGSVVTAASAVVRRHRRRLQLSRPRMVRQRTISTANARRCAGDDGDASTARDVSASRCDRRRGAARGALRPAGRIRGLDARQACEARARIVERVHP